MKELLIIAIGSAIVNNVVLSQFLGICPFLGVSKKVETATGMGGAVVFVITLSSFFTGLIYKFILVPLGFEYLQTIVFILFIAALVQFVEMFLKKSMPSLYKALGVYLPLITTNCAVLGVALTNVQTEYSILEGVVNGIGMGLGFTFGLTCIAIVREFIGTGAIFGVQILPLADAAAGKGGYVPVTIFILPAGAFLVLAFLVAGMNRLKRHAAQKGKKIAEPQGCGTDCASCGGCGSKVFPTGNEE